MRKDCEHPAEAIAAVDATCVLCGCYHDHEGWWSRPEPDVVGVVAGGETREENGIVRHFLLVETATNTTAVIGQALYAAQS